MLSCYCVIWVPFLFWRLTPYQMYSLQIFSPVLEVDSFLCRSFLIQCNPICLFLFFKKWTNVLILYYSWIHPLHHSPLSPPPQHSWNSFNMSHFFIFTHEYIIFLLHSPSHAISLYLPPSHWFQTSEMTCFTFLLSVFEKRWFYLHKVAIQEFQCNISMYICTITQIVSFPLFFSFLPESSSYCDFSRFKNPVFIFVKKVHQPYSPS
jgi:hypothetical protein